MTRYRCTGPGGQVVTVEAANYSRAVEASGLRGMVSVQAIGLDSGPVVRGSRLYRCDRDGTIAPYVVRVDASGNRPRLQATPQPQTEVIR